MELLPSNFMCSSCNNEKILCICSTIQSINFIKYDDTILSDNLVSYENITTIDIYYNNTYQSFKKYIYNSTIIWISRNQNILSSLDMYKLVSYYYSLIY